MGRRAPLPLVWTALVLGSLICPYGYVAIGALGKFKPIFALVAVPALITSTWFLFSAFLFESRFERALKRRLGRGFRVVFGLLLLLALGVSYAVLSIISDFTLFTDLEYWFTLFVMFAGSSVAVLVVVLFTGAPRLERILAARLASASSSLLRMTAWALMAALAISVVALLYWYHQSIQPPVY